MTHFADIEIDGQIDLGDDSVDHFTTDEEYEEQEYDEELFSNDVEHMCYLENEKPVGNKNACQMLDKIFSAGAGPGRMHPLMVGPSGHGKTSIATYYARKHKLHRVMVNANTLHDHNDLYAVLKQIKKNTVLLIDEIHSLNTKLQEAFYTILETFTFKRISGRGSQKICKTIKLPDFIFVGCTTNENRLLKPLRNRLLTISLQPYTFDELVEIAFHKAAWCIHNSRQADVLAQYSRGNPRTLTKLAGMCLLNEVCSVDGMLILFSKMNIMPNGVTQTEYLLMKALEDRKILSLNSLAAILKLDADVVEEEHEPYLVELGYLIRGKQGRELTQDGKNYLKGLRNVVVVQNNEPQKEDNKADFKDLEESKLNEESQKKVVAIVVKQGPAKQGPAKQGPAKQETVSRNNVFPIKKDDTHDQFEEPKPITSTIKGLGIV